MEVVTVQGEVRDNLGKRSTKDVRIGGLVPGVIYGVGEAIHFTTVAKNVKDLIYSANFKLAEVEVGGKTYRCILKDMQFHPVTEQLLHLDFLQLEEGQSVRIEVPIRFVGVSPGVKSGGKLQQNLRRVKIKTTPEHLVDEMIADISKLKMGQSVRVKDLKEVKGVEVINSSGIPVATVVVPRAMRSAASGAEEEELAAEAGEGQEAAAAEE